MQRVMENAEPQTQISMLTVVHHFPLLVPEQRRETFVYGMDGIGQVSIGIANA